MSRADTAALGLVAALAFPPLTANAQVQAVKLAPDEAVRLDGRLDESIWERAPAFENFRQVDPYTGGGPATYRTTVRVAFDEKALYFAVFAHDPDPSQIRAPRVRYDKVFRDQDFIVVYVDGMGTRAAAQFFRINAGGATADGVHTGATDNEDFSPDFEWDAAVQITADGYGVEVRIPFSTLRFPHESGRPWRVQVARRMPREQTYLFIGAPFTRESPNFIAEMPTLEGFNGPQEDFFWQIRPGLTVSRTEVRSGNPTVVTHSTEASVDAKLRPRADWVFDATLNPDFSQIELDVPQLVHSRQFAIFLSEKRPFFLEGSDLLQTPTDTLYTRAVTSPRWGARATYRGEALAGTVLSAADRGGGTVLIPGPFATDYALQPENRAVSARMRVDTRLDGQQLAIGATASERSYTDAGYNRVAGPDMVWSLNHNQVLRAQWLGSRTSAMPDGVGGLQNAPERNGHAANIEWLRNSGTTAATLRYREASEDFRNDNGFLPQAGFRAERATVNRQFRPTSPGRLLNEITPYVDLDRARTIRGDERISSDVRPGLYVAGLRGLEINLQARPLERTRLRAGGALHEYRQGFLGVSALPSRIVTLFWLEYTAGERVDIVFDRVRPGSMVSTGGRVRLGRSFEIEPRYDRSLLQADNGRRAIVETASQLLSVLHFGPQDSLRLIAQHTSYEITADAQPGNPPSFSSGSIASLVYAHRRSANNVLYLGATRSAQPAAFGDLRSTEVFAKIQFAV